MTLGMHYQLFQLTTSRGGRLRFGRMYYSEPRISTHDLTRRSTATNGTLQFPELFQLTTSRGGRLIFWR